MSASWSLGGRDGRRDSGENPLLEGVEGLLGVSQARSGHKCRPIRHRDRPVRALRASGQEALGARTPGGAEVETRVSNSNIENRDSKNRDSKIAASPSR